MKNQHKASVALCVLCAAAAVSVPARADLVLQGPMDFSGTGLGAVSTVLTLQSPGNATFESGSVAPAAGGAGDVITGDALTGASQTLTRSIGSLGLTSADSIRIVFNAVEPGAAAQQGIVLEDLRLNIYSPTGALLFTSGAFTPVSFADTFSGAGNAGFVFALDATQAAQAQLLAFGAGYAANVIGLSASASNAQGGPDTFFVAAAPVPEAPSWALGLAGIAVVLQLSRRLATTGSRR